MKQRNRGVKVLLMLFVLCAMLGCADEPGGRHILSDPALMNSPDYSIGVPQGTAAMTVVENKFPKSRIEYHMSLHDGYLAVLYGKLDAFAFDRHALHYVAAHNPDLVLMDQKIGDEFIVVGTALGREDLIEKVNDFIRQYRADGTYQDMYDRWINGKSPRMPVLPEPENPSITLKIAADGRNEPMSFYQDGQLIGFDIEFAKRLALFMNAKCTFYPIEFPAVIDATVSGKADLLIANLNGTPERRKMMLFSDPYVDSEISFLVRKDRLAKKSIPKETDFSRFTRKKIGVQTGTIYEKVLKENIPQAFPAYFTTYTDQIEALKSGKIDGFLVDDVVADEMSRQTEGITYLPKRLSSNNYAFAFSKKNRQLHSRVNAILHELRDDGTLKKLGDKWFGSDQTLKQLPSFVNNGKNGVIRFATNSDSAPFVYMKDGKLVGYDIEVAMIIAERLGYKLQIMDMDFSAIIPSLVSGKADMAGAFIVVTEERAKSVLFSIPNYTGKTVVVVWAGQGNAKSSAVRDFSELAGKKVGIITGSAYDAILKRHIPGAIPAYFNNFSDQSEAVRSGKIAGFLVDEPMARDIMNNTDGLTVLKPPLTSDGYAFAFSKKQPQLHRRVNHALKQMIEDGTLKEIDARWFGADDVVKVLPDLKLDGRNGIIRLATNGNVAPFAYMKNGKIVGYDIEIAMRIAFKLGYGLEIIDTDFAAIIPSLVSGKSDMIACGLTITEERAKSVLFSIPNYKGGIVVLVAAVEAAAAETSEGLGGEGFWSGLTSSFRSTFIVEDRYKLVLQGLWVTMVISILSAIFGTILGFGVCMMRRAPSRWANIPAKVFIRSIQGTPIVVLLMILYYIVFGSTDINAILVAVVGFSMNFAAYVSEMMRTGIDAVDRGQHEAAYALGFNRLQVFTKITFPQAARHVLPVFKGEFISMLKMTSIVGYIAIQDLTKMSDIIRSRTYEAFFPLIATALIYFVIAYGMAYLLSLVEISVDPKRRKRIVKGVVNP